MEMKEKQSQAEGEDMSDMVAEHVAKQKVRPTTHMHTLKIPEWVGMDISAHISDYTSLGSDRWQLSLN